ncbi:sensor histidine kinase [Dyella choica]|uniref:Sensor histidine kinase n=1 Tax=Dyella choica TaxID=1927959 RepID=A0A3S0PK47_9GAMM|nr:sensor histidine kinase [Dyella choica]RUL72467.1 sensor histidine kinase [Dyella choica]
MDKPFTGGKRMTAMTQHLTTWYSMGYIALAMAVVIGLAVFRYRQMAARLRDRLEVRHAERERIARELHDTLLQGIQGLILRFQAIAEQIPEGDPIRARIDQALTRAEEVLVDGRDRVHDLRLSEGAAKDLAMTFESLGMELQAENPAKFQLFLHGTRREVDPVILEEIYLIGREAMLNAFRHARATTIAMDMAFESKQFLLRVQDNGIGIDPDILETGYKPGHWGLRGMRERAQCIGGSCSISSLQGQGTAVELQVPSHVAYITRRPARWATLTQLSPGTTKTR